MVALPVHAPVQPVKVEKDPVLVVRVTTVPKFTLLLQVPVLTLLLRVQAITPDARMEPLPVPLGVAVSITGASKRALAARLVFMVSVQLLPVLPAQSPLHAPKLLGELALAESVTDVPLVTLIEQLPLVIPAVITQLSPTGLVTTPVPFPLPVIVSVRKARKATPTVRACDVAIVQVLPVAALQSLVHDNNSESAAGVVVSTTCASPGNVNEQLPVSTDPFTAQSMPAGAERTVA